MNIARKRVFMFHLANKIWDDETVDQADLALLRILNENDDENNKWNNISYEGHFSLDDLPQPCTDLFRFKEDEIIQLSSILLLEFIITKKRYKCPRVEALCLVLRRLSYPNRWTDLVPLFRRSISVMSEIFSTTIELLHQQTSHLCEFNFQRIIDDIDRFCLAIHNKGAPYENCFGFIDGTFRKSCRPNKFQKVAFSGHKRAHGIKFQGVTTPDGIIQEMYGPFPAHRHDSYILKQSGLLEKLETNCLIDGKWHYLYGDPAYPIRAYLVRPFKGNISAAELNHNYVMSKVRQSVEWAFKDVIQQFAFLDYNKNLAATC